MENNNLLDKHAGGRPLKFETVEELDRAIQNYFANCNPHETKALVETGRDSEGNLLYDTRNVLTQQKPYTMAGLARALRVSRQTLLNYSHRDEFLDSIAAAKQRCEEYAESQLYGPYANGAKFSLANNFSTPEAPYSDKHSVDHTSKGERVNPYGELTADQLRRLAEQDGDEEQAPQGE